MPGWTNADNKFGPTKWMVGQTLGDGVNYTSIQTAVNHAFASLVGNDHADVYIRPGNYSEDLVLPGSVNLIGTSVSGEPDPSAVASVRVVSDIQVDGNAQTICSGIFFITSGNINNVNFTLIDTGGGTASVKLINCNLESTSNNFVLGSAAGGGAVEMQNCKLEAAGRNIEIPNGSTLGTFSAYSSLFQSNADSCIYIDGGVAGTGLLNQCSLVAAGSNTIFFDTNATGYVIQINGCYLQAPSVSPILFQTAAVVQSYNNTFEPAGNSEYITGPGSYFYADDHIIGGKLSSGIDNAATQTIAGWRPWAESDTTGTTVVRGTAAFNSTQFNVTEGFVETNFSGIFPWVDQNGSTAVNANEGNFSTANITLTMPSPVNQGDTCKFKVVAGGTVLIIQAAGGQTLQIGQIQSSVAGTATSTFFGDSVEFTWYAAASTWVANSVIGNWTLA